MEKDNRANRYSPETRARAVRMVLDNQVNYESLQNLTPADVYFGRGQTILRQRETIKRKTIETRRLLHRESAA